MKIVLFFCIYICTSIQTFICIQKCELSKIVIKILGLSIIALIFLAILKHEQF